MSNTQHIQYPVGQGGLHLGIIGEYAYIYDCGGCGGISKSQWKNIFAESVNFRRYARRGKSYRWKKKYL